MSINNRTWIMAVWLGIVLILVFWGFTQCGGKKMVWADSFSSEVTQPYGSYLVYRHLGDLFLDDSITTVNQSMFDQLVYEFPMGVSYIFIGHDFILFEEDLAELTDFIERGNQAFIAASDLDNLFEEKMEIFLESLIESVSDSINIRFTSGLPADELYTYPSKNMRMLSFEGDQKVEILAETTQGSPVFVRKRIGKGWLYISSCPRMLTNYYMVHPEQHRVISQMFSYLPLGGHLWWDEFYKPNNIGMYRQRRGSSGDGGESKNRDKLDFVFEHEALKWAFWLIILGLILYALFEGKRKQRLIPIIRPLPNMTLDFTETIGMLYFQSKNHKNLAEKRIRILFARIREDYYLKTDIIDEVFLTSLSAKSGLPEVEIQQLFYTIKNVRNSASISEDQLIELSLYIDNFYQKSRS